MTDDIGKLLQSLADRFCERKSLKCLLWFLPGYFALNGLTDGWEECRRALADTRAFCNNDLQPDETENIDTAINLINRMLAQTLK